MRSFIVAGPESSGNRLMAAILVRAGLSGEGSTNQPKDPSEIDYTQEQVIIKHYDLGKWIVPFLHHGHSVTVIVMAREPHAQANSAYKHGHYASASVACIAAPHIIKHNLIHALESGCRVEVIPYASLCDAMLIKFLERHGLRTDNTDQPLQLVGQDAPSTIENMNHVHYENNLVP